MGNLCCGGDSSSSHSSSRREKRRGSINNQHHTEAAPTTIIGRKEEAQQQITKASIKPLPRLVDDDNKSRQQHQQRQPEQNHDNEITPEMNIWPPPEPNLPTTQIEMNIWSPQVTTPEPTHHIANKPHAKEEIHKPHTMDDPDILIQNNIWPPPPSL